MTPGFPRVERPRRLLDLRHFGSAMASGRACLFTVGAAEPADSGREARHDHRLDQVMSAETLIQEQRSDSARRTP